MPLAAGKLDRRITIQRATITRDAYNEAVQTWADLATVWASYEPVSDGEKFRAGERASAISARFVIRHSSTVADVNPADQLIFKGQVHQILGVKEAEGRGVGIEITTVTRSDG